MKKIKVAVVDDEADFLEILSLYVESEVGFSNYTFYFFQSGSEFLKVSHSTDYLLTDINMPVIDGYTLIGEVKKTNPHIKVSVMSAYSDQESRKKAEALGADHFFVKPLDFDNIREHLEKIYGKRSSQLSLGL